MKIERKKDKKTTGTSYKVNRVGDIDSTLTEGTLNVLNFRAKGIGMVFRT